MRTCLFLSSLCLLLSTTASLSAETARLSSDQRKRITAIKKELALSGADSMALVKELVGFGTPGHRQSSSIIKKLLDNDERIIKGNAKTIGDRDKMSAFESKLAELRTAAWANLKQLGKGEPLMKAKEFHDSLQQTAEPLKQAYALQMGILEGMGRRAELLDAYRSVAPDDTRNFQEEDEAELRQLAETALGSDLASITTTLNASKAPEGPLENVWLYRQARRIESYNASMRDQVSTGEWDNLVAVNNYRENLGVRPYELDPRLVQAARKHSKAMADKNFFSHSGVTPETKSHTQRMKNAGYKGGYSENIHKGSSGGTQAFWCWFSSPPHHKNIVNAGNKAIGIGQWGILWTQNMGRGKSLMGLSSEARQQSIQGSILDPQ